MPRVAFITASVGGVEKTTKPVVEQTIPSDFFAYCDEHTISDSGWQRVEATKHLSDGLASQWTNRLVVKWYKMKWSDWLHGYDAVVWLDSQMEIVNPRTAEIAIHATASAPLAAFPHSLGHTLAQEVEAARGHYGQDPQGEAMLLAQAESYAREGLPMGERCFTGGFLMFNPKHAQLRPMLDAWFEENRRHTTRDQVSLPYVAWKHGVRIASLEEFGTWQKHSLAVLHGHGK